MNEPYLFGIDPRQDVLQYALIGDVETETGLDVYGDGCAKP